MSAAADPSAGPLDWVVGRERLCGLAGALTIAFSSILVRLSHASPSTAAIFRCVYALPVLALLARAERRRFGPRRASDRRASLAAGVFFAADLLLWHHSIGDVGAGLSTVLANVQVVLVPLIAWALLSERPSRAVLIMLPVTLVGVLLISGALETGAYGRNPVRGTVFGFGAGFAYVGFLLLLRRGRRRSAPAGGAAVRRDRGGGGAVRDRGSDHRRRPSRADLALGGLAAGAGHDLAGHRMAADRHDPAAPARGADLDPADPAAGRLGRARRR